MQLEVEYFSLLGNMKQNILQYRATKMQTDLSVHNDNVGNIFVYEFSLIVYGTNFSLHMTANSLNPLTPNLILFFLTTI